MRADRAFGLGYWHWFFLAQPAPTPERMIGADPDAYYRRLRRGLLRRPRPSPTYRRAADDPDTIRAMCEDYRAGAGLDVEHDLADKNHRRRIACPLLALWGGRWYLEDWYDVLGIWREWADDVSGRARRRRALPRRGAPGRRPRRTARLLRYDPLLSGAPPSVAFEMTIGTIGCSLPFAGTFAMRSTVALPSGDLADERVVRRQARVGGGDDEELAARRARRLALGLGHRDGALRVLEVRGRLLADRVAGAAEAVAERVAALDDEGRSRSPRCGGRSGRRRSRA